MSANDNTVLFLGSGATAGSAQPPRFPADGNFFRFERVRELLTIHCPTLSLFRNWQGPIARDGLYQTWNDLFVYRGLGRSGVLRENKERENQFRSLANHPWDGHQQAQCRHYQCQFQILHEQPMIAVPWEYHFAELAIWDLRVLVFHVYTEAGSQNPNSPYRLVFNRLASKLAGIVNFNYDDTFDQEVENRIFYPGDGRSSRDRIPLIHPHGSLAWSDEMNWVRRNGFQGSPVPRDIPVTHDNIGYSERKDGNGFLLRQPLIVTPADAKEEVIGNSSMSGLNNDILRPQWLEFQSIAFRAKHWVFIGFSFSSGDQHLMSFLRWLYSENPKQLCVSVFNPGDRANADRLMANLLEVINGQGQVCLHPIQENEDIGAFLNQRDCPLLQ